MSTPDRLQQSESLCNGGDGLVVATATQLSKVYGSGVTKVIAVNEVSAEFRRGEFTAIMGPSGSGKSTFMHCMAGLDSITDGSAQIDGVELRTLNDGQLTKLRRDKLGFIFQAYNLVPTLNALENITLPLDIAGSKPDEKWLRQVIETVDLGDRLKHGPTELSGGQQQRVACARAFASKPAIIFGDEPTGNLDSRTGAEILVFLRNSVRTLRQTIVMVTHDPAAASYADRVLFLSDGRIVDQLNNPNPDTVLARMSRLDVRGRTN